MIRYLPMRQTPSASVKDEQIFDTLDQMKLYILDYMGRIARYIGHDPFLPGDIVFQDASEYDIVFGIKHARSVYLKTMCIGFCGE